MRTIISSSLRVGYGEDLLESGIHRTPRTPDEVYAALSIQKLGVQTPLFTKTM